MLPIGQIAAGKWQGALPDEVVDFELMRFYPSMSWQDVHDLPVYVRGRMVEWMWAWRKEHPEG